MNLFLFPFFSAEDMLFIFYIMARIMGVFVISPLLSNKSINASIRLILTFFTALLLAMVYYPDYRGPNPTYAVEEMNVSSPYLIFNLLFLGIRELLIGYLIGMIFNIVFEAMLLAGETIDTMIGFSTAQFLDPFSNTFQSLLGQLLVLLSVLLTLIWDYHFTFFYVIASSFNILPLGDYHLNTAVIQDIAYSTSLLFVYGIKVAAIPMVILACGLVGIAFTIRVVPEMNLLLTGLPMRILIGYYTLMLAMHHIPPVFQTAFLQITTLVERLIEDLRL